MVFEFNQKQNLFCWKLQVLCHIFFFSNGFKNTGIFNFYLLKIAIGSNFLLETTPTVENLSIFLLLFVRIQIKNKNAHRCKINIHLSLRSKFNITENGIIFAQIDFVFLFYLKKNNCFNLKLSTYIYVQPIFRHNFQNILY